MLDLPEHQTRRIGSKMGGNAAPVQPAIRARTLDDLYKTVLSWDYDNLNSAKVYYFTLIKFVYFLLIVTQDESKMQKVPKTFSSAEEYISIFEPLLMMEIVSQLEHGKEESGNHHFGVLLFTFL